MYAISDDNENFYGLYETKEEAIKDGCKEYAEQEEFYVGEIYYPEISFSDGEKIAENVIECIQNDLEYECGEAAENFDLTDGETASLAEYIENAVNEWIKFREIKPGFYMIRDSEHIRVPDFAKGSL